MPNLTIAATELTGKYIHETYGPVKVKVAGSQSLRKSLERAGHQVLSDDSRETATVVVHTVWVKGEDNGLIPNDVVT